MPAGLFPIAIKTHGYKWDGADGSGWTVPTGQRQEGKLCLAGKLIMFLTVIPTNATEAYIFRKNN